MTATAFSLVSIQITWLMVGNIKYYHE